MPKICQECNKNKAVAKVVLDQQQTLLCKPCLEQTKKRLAAAQKKQQQQQQAAVAAKKPAVSAPVPRSELRVFVKTVVFVFSHLLSNFFFYKFIASSPGRNFLLTICFILT
jgi:hypothetical protein